MAFTRHAESFSIMNRPKGKTFVIRQITQAVPRIRLDARQKLCLDNLDTRRDWGVADDYIDAMWAMLEQDVRGDYVIGAGESHSARQFVELALGHAALDWREYVQTDSRYYRPAEVADMCTDGFTTRRELGLEPRVDFQKLEQMMADADTESLGRKITGGLAALGPAVRRFS